MRPETVAVLGPILRDLASSGVDVRVDEDWQPSARHDPDPSTTVMVWTPDGSGTGVLVGEPGAPVDVEALYLASDAVHDAVVEARWAMGLSTAWPPCAWHPGGHPMILRVHDGKVVWTCSTVGTVACCLGDLCSGSPAGSS